jgi:hypothetical protein
MGFLNKYPNIYALGVLKNMNDMEYEWTQTYRNEYMFVVANIGI